MPKSISEILSEYQKLKKQESENKVRQVFQTIGKAIVDHGGTGAAAIQDVLGGDTDIKKAVTDVGKSNEIKKLGLASFVESIGGFLGKVQEFAKANIGKKEDFAKQAAPINGIIGAAGALVSETDNLKNSEDDKQGILKNLEIQITKVGRMGVSVLAQAFKYHRLLHSSVDFTYWVESKLAKRGILLEYISVLDKIADDLELIDIAPIESQGLVEVKRNLFNKKNEKSLAEQVDNLSVIAHSKLLHEQVAKLEDVFKKNYSGTASELETKYFERNKNVIAFLIGVTPDKVQTSEDEYGEDQKFDEKRVQSFVNQLEKEHASQLLIKREELIQNRVIAEFDNLDESSQNKVIQMVNAEKLPWKNKEDTSITPEQLSAMDKKQATIMNDDYKKSLDGKVEKERKSIIGKSLMLASAVLLLASVAALLMSGGAVAVIPLAVCAGILFIVGKKLFPDAAKDLLTDASEFFEKFKKELGISQFAKQIKEESKNYIPGEPAIREIQSLVKHGPEPSVEEFINNDDVTHEELALLLADDAPEDDFHGSEYINSEREDVPDEDQAQSKKRGHSEEAVECVTKKFKEHLKVTKDDESSTHTPSFKS